MLTTLVIRELLCESTGDCETPWLLLVRRREASAWPAATSGSAHARRTVEKPMTVADRAQPVSQYPLYMVRIRLIATSLSICIFLKPSSSQFRTGCSVQRIGGSRANFMTSESNRDGELIQPVTPGRAVEVAQCLVSSTKLTWAFLLTTR